MKTLGLPMVNLSIFEINVLPFRLNHKYERIATHYLTGVQRTDCDS
jgi:hypothetical protein